MILLILKALLVGFILTITSLGPSKLMAMQRTFVYGPKNGLTLAAGSAFVDILYSLIPAIGMTFWALDLDAWRPWIDYAFLVMAIVWGIVFALKNTQLSQKEGGRMNVAGAFGIGFGLNIINPSNVATVTAGFALLGMNLTGVSTGNAILIAACVGLGSFAAWGAQIYLFHYLREHITEKRLAFIIRCVGLTLAVGGAFGLGYMVADVIDIF